MVFKQKAKKTSSQITISENLDNNEDPKRDIDVIYMGSRKRQDLLSKLGAWGPWERVEGKGKTGRGAEKDVEYNKNQ